MASAEVGLSVPPLRMARPAAAPHIEAVTGKRGFTEEISQVTARATSAVRAHAASGAKPRCAGGSAALAASFAVIGCGGALMTERAAAAEEQAPRRFEVTALLGYRGGGDFDVADGAGSVDIEAAASYGAALGWRVDAQKKYELLYDLQRTRLEGIGVDLDIEHLHLGGTAAIEGLDSALAFISGGIGATRFRPASGADETRFSLSLGLGLDVPLAERVGMRLEARGYLVSMDSDSAIFCSSGPAGGTCLVRATGDVLFQYALLAGIGVRF